MEDSIVIGNPLVRSILNAAGSPTLLCIFGGHLLINLKEAGEMGVNEGTNYRSNSISDIDFAEGQFSFNSSAFRQVLRMIAGPRAEGGEEVSNEQSVVGSTV